MAPSDEGLRNEALLAALKEALGGRPARLEGLLALHGAVLAPKPNLRLAAAFGAEVAALPGRSVVPLLSRLAADDAAPDTDRAFLPIAAAHGWAARVRAGSDLSAAWAGLADLAADERVPVRLGTVDALVTIAVREGGAEALVEHAAAWIESDDRERLYSIAAIVVEVLAHGDVLSTLHDHAALFDYLSAVLALIENVPRSAIRSDGLRRLSLALPRTLAAVVALPGGGQAWMERECKAATEPALRAILSEGIVRLASRSRGPASWVVTSVRAALEGSAKPLRDPTRRRPGQGRGKVTRSIR